MKQIKIFLADDHELFLQGLVALLKESEAFEIVGTAKNGQEVLDQIEGLEIDILILDIEMPGINGIEVAKVVKVKYPDTKILALSMYNEKRFILKMINLGINGYVLKDKSRELLEHAIRQIEGGNNYFSPEVMNELSKPDNQAIKSPEEVKLSEREMEVLIEVAKGLTSKEVGEKLYITETTVSTHRRNIMKKLNVPNERFLVHYAIKHALIEI